MKTCVVADCNEQGTERVERDEPRNSIYRAVLCDTHAYILGRRDRADVIADQVRGIVIEALHEALRGGPRVPIEIADDARARVRALLDGEDDR